jgi:hypothetical protein
MARKRGELHRHDAGDLRRRRRLRYGCAIREPRPRRQSMYILSGIAFALLYGLRPFISKLQRPKDR